MYALYKPSFSDSTIKKDVLKNLFLLDASTFSLFKAILKTSGRNRLEGKKKGGIKKNTVIHAPSLMPTFIRFSAAAANDQTIYPHLHLPENSYVLFDKGYTDYSQYANFTEKKIYFVTRQKQNAKYKSLSEFDLTDKVPDSILFKKLKQNFNLNYFVGDNQNAIEIQIWSALIALLLLSVLHQQNKSTIAFSNFVHLVGLHLMNYITIASITNFSRKIKNEYSSSNLFNST